MAALRRAISEPLIQFLLIGLVIFAAERALRPDVVDPRTITVDTAAYARLAGIFNAAEERLPTPDEMDRLVERYIINETLFREARALELDHGDEMMRERLIQRMRLLIYSGIEIPDPGDAVLRPWFEARLARYETQPRLSFRVIALDGTEDQARDEADKAATREAAGEPVKPEGLRLVSFVARARNQLVATFEEDFVAAIEAAPEGLWTPVPSYRGWQVAQRTETIPASAPSFDDLRARVLSDWREDEVHRTARAALDTLMASYPVDRKPYDPDAVADLLPSEVPAQ